MGLWDRDYMHERWRKMHLLFGEDEFSAKKARPARRDRPIFRATRESSGIPAEVWVFVLACVVAMLFFLFRAASSIWSS